MKINFSQNIKNFQIQRMGNKNITRPNFKGLNHDVFEKSSVAKNDLNKRIEELKNCLSQKQAACDELAERIYTSFDTTMNAFAEKKLETIKRQCDEIKRELAYTIYEQRKEINLNTAFFYNPDLSSSEKLKKASEKQEIIRTADFEDKFPGSQKFVFYWIKNGYLDADLYENVHYIDTSFPKNQKFLKEYEEKTKEKPTVGEIIHSCNCPKEKMLSYMRSGKIKLAYSNEESALNTNISKFYWHVDTDDELTKKTIKDHIKTTPQRAGKYYKGLNKSAAPVPIGILAKLGFGSPKEIFSLVKKGQIKGKITDVTKKDGTKAKSCYVNVNDDYTENALKSLRDKNENIVEVRSLTKRLGISRDEFNQRVLNDEISIIPQFIFSDEHNKVFVDLTHPFNKQLAQELENSKKRRIK